ncbi:hypothetical protein HZS_5261 [Henneguya salminicola]|nr:hypothetical protein HZS_5261 [Henneguya salminicola]
MFYLREAHVKLDVRFKILNVPPYDPFIMFTLLVDFTAKKNKQKIAIQIESTTFSELEHGNIIFFGNSDILFNFKKKFNNFQFLMSTNNITLKSRDFIFPNFVFQISIKDVQREIILNTTTFNVKHKIFTTPFKYYYTVTDEEYFLCKFRVKHDYYGYKSYKENKIIEISDEKYRYDRTGNMQCRDAIKIDPPTCIKNLNHCEPNICSNEGFCILRTQNEKITRGCECPPRFFGLTCKHIRRCANCIKMFCGKYNNCLNCRRGWIGENCTVKSCAFSEMCRNNGSCKIINNTRKCKCRPGFVGKLCEIDCVKICDATLCKVFKHKIFCPPHSFLKKYVYRLLSLLLLFAIGIIIFFLVRKFKKKSVINDGSTITMKSLLNSSHLEMEL